MLRKLYNIFISPRQKSEDDRNREIVLNLLLSGTLLILILVLPLLSLGYFFLRHHYVSPSMYIVASAILFIGYLYRLSRKGHFRVAAFMLVGLYYILATSIVYLWGVNVPSGILLYGLVIVLAGILMGPNHSLYFAGAVVLTLVYLELGARYGSLSPDLSWVTEPPTMGDVAGFSLIFAIIALVSWIFNHQMERSLHRAERAEKALLKQKSLLETTVERRTEELRTAQLEKIQQMYRFAELGQLSTAMMHDLANHLTSLTLNIESLKGEKRSKVLADAKRSIRHIDDMVVRVRDQLRGKSKAQPFNVINEIDEIVKMLRHRGQIAEVRLLWEPPQNKKSLRCLGDAIRFRQMMANLISNGFDSYYSPRPGERREVLITAEEDKSYIVITVNDWGRGIPAAERPKLFEPFHSNKATGMGMGLFIVKQIAEEHFMGSARIDESKNHTAFVVRLPKAAS